MFDIISMGDYILLAEALNGLAMIFSSSPIANMMKLAFLIGILFFGGRAALYNKWDATPLLAGFIAYLCMFGPKVTVTVTDGYSGAVRVVANVPIGIAAPMGITSHTGRYFASTFDSAFSVISTGSSMYTEGYLNAIEVLLKMRAPSLGWSSVVSDNRIEGSLVNYLRDCVYLDLSMNDPGNANEVDADKLANSKDTWAALKTTFVNIYTISYIDTAYNTPESISCEDAYTKLTAKIVSPGPWLTTYYDTYLQSLMGASRQAFPVSAETRISNALAAINLSASDSRTWMVNTMLSTALRNADSAFQVGQGNVAGTVMITQAATQRNARWIAEKSMFEQVARPITAFIELFMVGASPIMAFAIGAFGHIGLSLAGKFLLMHVWVSLWIPTTALVNAYMAHTLSTFVQWTQFDKGIELLSQSGLDQLNSQLQTQYATGGMLAAAVPMLTLMLIYGSSQVATSLASRMGGSEYVDPKQVAPNIVDTGPVVSQASSWTQNPGTQTQQRTGAALPTFSVGSQIDEGASLASSISSQKAATASDMFNRRWGLSEVAGEKVSMGTDGRLTGTGTYSEGLSAVYNKALAAGREVGMSGNSLINYARSVADNYTSASNFGGKASVGTGDAMPYGQLSLGGGHQWTSQYAEQMAHGLGVNVQQLRAANTRFNEGASTDQRIAAGFESAKSRSDSVSSGRDYSKAEMQESARAISTAVQDTQSAAETYQNLKAIKNGLGMNASMHSHQLVNPFKSTFGADWASRVESAWDSFHSNKSPDQADSAKAAALDGVRRSGMFRDSGMSSARDQGALEKMWAMLSDPVSAPQFMQDLAKVSGINTGSAGSSDPASWRGSVAQGNLHKADIFSKAGEAQPQGQAVQDGVQGSIQSRAGQAAAWRSMLQSNFSPDSVKEFYKSKGAAVSAADDQWRALAEDFGKRASSTTMNNSKGFVQWLMNADQDQLKETIRKFADPQWVNR